MQVLTNYLKKAVGFSFISSIRYLIGRKEEVVCS